MISLLKNQFNFRNMGLVFFMLPVHYEMHLVAAIKSNETHSREEKKVSPTKRTSRDHG